MKLHQRFLLFNLFFLLFINSSPSLANDVEKSVDTYAYHPGLYAHDMSISALDSSRFNHIRGVVVLYKMKDLMPSENSVNLQPIHDSISQLKNLKNYQGDGRLIIQVTYNRDYALPGWMKKNPKFGWAGVTANGYSENRNAPGKIYGVFYRTGKPSSITSYSGNYAPIYTNPEWVKVHNRLMQAIANEFDSNPLVEMIAGVTGETSKYDPPVFSGWRWGRNGNPTEYEYLRERIDTVSSMFSQTRMRVTYNYLDSSYPGGVNAMRNSIELDIANKGVVLSSPDVHPSYHSKCSQYFGKVGSRCNKGIDQTYPTNAIFRYFQEYKDRIPTVATISSESIYNNPRGVNKRRNAWYRNNDTQLVQASAQDFIDLLLNQPDGVWAQHHDSDVRDFYGNGGPQVHYIFVVGYSGLSEDRGKYNFLRETGGFADKIKSYLDAGGTIPPSSVNYVSNSGGGAPTPGDDTLALPLVMTLSGSNPVTVVQGKSFIDPGAIVSRDGDFVKVVMSNDRVNINKKGKYILTYAAQDSYGSKVTAVRTVNVVSSGSGGGNTPIRVDGNISDWKGVTPIATANSQSLKTLKMVSDASHIYFLIEGSGIGVNTQLHLNVDNKAATGYQTNNWKSSGIDYLVENDWLYKSTRNDASWSWGSANSSAVVYKRSSSAIEISVKKSAISGLKETIKVGAWDLNGSWNIVSGLPKFGNAMAVFSAGSTPPPPPEPPAQDKTPPVITLNGSSSMTLAQGSSFVDPGATAWDNRDGNVNVTKRGSVNSSREGRYTITYSARDKAGNEATKTRIVNVVSSGNGGGNTPIRVDGHVSDWKGVTPIATANSQSLKTLKMVSDASHIYFLIEGSDIGVNTQLHLNVDNKAATGYQTNNWKSSGIDYLVENDWLYKSTRNDASWSWGSANSSAVVYKRSSSAIEISVKKSAISGLEETIKVGAWDLNGSWNIVSGLPKFGNAMAVFSAGSTPPPPPEPPAQDKTPPVITLNGSSSMTLAQGSSFVDPGATAWDNRDGNVNVTKRGSVNSSREGRYTITYSARDKAGNEATKTRVVVVRVNSSGTDKPYLVLAGDFTPTNVNANISYIETLPFDGGIITPVTSWIIANGNSHPGYGALWNEIKDMNFRKWDKNYLLLMIGNPPDFFDDWSNVIAYWRDYAKAAKAMGTFAGIAFDNEEYAGPVWGYPGAVNYRNRSLQAYRDQARLRGRQIMQAMQEEFPDISVIHYHGPYASDPNTPNAVSLYQLEPDESNLMGSFFMGMVEAKNATSKVIDGGEVYQYRTPDEFKNSYQWRKYTMASSSNNSPVIPRNERSAYPDNVSISFGLYNYNWTQWVDGTGHPMNPSIMENVVEYSLNNADDVVWLYTEDMNWAGGGVSSAWINAVRNGREAAKGGVLE